MRARASPLSPPPADLARINQDAARENGWLRVEYVEPIPSDRRVRPSAIEEIDANEITFRTVDGGTASVRLDAVRGLTVKDRWRGALIGGAVFTAGMSALMLAAYEYLGIFDGKEPHCGAACDAQFFAYMVGTAALAGVVFGYLIGVRRTFYFDRRH